MLQARNLLHITELDAHFSTKCTKDITLLWIYIVIISQLFAHFNRKIIFFYNILRINLSATQTDAETFTPQVKKHTAYSIPSRREKTWPREAVETASE